MCLMTVHPAFGQALEKVQPSPAPTASDESQEAMKRFAELSKKVSQQPELQKLKKQFDESRRAYFDALSDAIAKEDAELMQRMQSLRGGSIPLPGLSNPLPEYSRLTKAEATQLTNARIAAQEAPGVKDARASRNAAKTEDERRSLDAEYKKALSAAMLKADPKLSDVLKKLEAPTPPAPKKTSP